MKLSQKFTLKILLYTAIIIVIFIDFIFNNTPEIFSFGNEFGTILSNLSLAYISSYIFYYTVVVIKDKQDKNNIYSTVYQWTKNLVGRAYSIHHEIISASGVENIDFDKLTISKEQYKELCNKANPNEKSKNKVLGTVTNYQLATHGQLLYGNAVSSVIAYSEKIFNYMPFLDSEHVRLINNLHNSKFFLVSDSLTYQTKNTNFSVYSDDMYDFLVMVRELDNYNETVIKSYLTNKNKQTQSK
jgi:hypothetical protein